MKKKEKLDKKSEIKKKRRPYEKPSLSSEKLFEANALKCNKPAHTNPS